MFDLKYACLGEIDSVRNFVFFSIENWKFWASDRRKIEKRYCQNSLAGTRCASRPETCPNWSLSCVSSIDYRHPII